MYFVANSSGFIGETGRSHLPLHLCLKPDSQQYQNAWNLENVFEIEGNFGYHNEQTV